MRELTDLLWNRSPGTEVRLLVCPDLDGLGRGPLTWRVLGENEDAFDATADLEGNPVVIVAQMRAQYLVLNLSSPADPDPIEAWFHRTDDADQRLLWLGAALGRVLAPAEARIPKVSTRPFHLALHGQDAELDQWLRRLRSSPPNHRPGILVELQHQQRRAQERQRQAEELVRQAEEPQQVVAEPRPLKKSA